MSENPLLQSTILSNLLKNEEYTRRVAPFIKREYFDGDYQKIFGTFIEFVTKYNGIPTIEALRVEMETNDTLPELGPVLKEIDAIAPDTNNIDHMLDTTEKWCQDRAIFIAVMESINIIDGGHKSLTRDALPDLLQKALSVTFDNSVGHDYINDSDSRYEFYHRVEERVPFDLDLFNIITKCGLPKKSLTVILASTGVGKSLFMCHHAAATLMLGKNVLYITMEMAEERIAERIDANLMNVELDTLKLLGKKQFDNKIDAIVKKSLGKLIIKEYPTGSAHVGHFRALLNELKLKKNFTPDFIFIDYLNICASSRVKAMGGSINSYTYIKAIAEEIRGMAVEFNVPVMTATQSNRDGANNSDVDLTNTSESFGVPATADLMFALISTEELEKLNQIMVKQLKNRYNDLNIYKRFIIGVDRAKMRLYDVEANAQNIIDSGTTGDQHPAANKKDFSSFKF